MSRLSIDMHRLHDEWASQPELMHAASLEAVEKRAAVDTAKAQLDVVTAECEMDIRENPSAFKIDKVTEASVKAAIVLHERRQKALAKLNKLKHEAAIFDAAVDAMEHRKKALENLVQLFLADYFSAPKAPRGGDEFMNAAKAELRTRGVRKPKKDADDD